MDEIGGTSGNDAVGPTRLGNEHELEILQQQFGGPQQQQQHQELQRVQQSGGPPQQQQFDGPQLHQDQQQQQFSVKYYHGNVGIINLSK